MTRDVGRNDPCPCGSGRKFKVCCLHGARTRVSNPPQPEKSAALQNQTRSSRFRFEAGSYGGPGGYFASIACLKQENAGGWRYHFVLVVRDKIHENEDAASLQAEQHLSEVFQGGSSPHVVAERLKEIGYVSVSDFRVVDDCSEAEGNFIPGTQ